MSITIELPPLRISDHDQRPLAWHVLRAYGVTHLEIAERVGVTEAYVSKVIGGRKPASADIRQAVVALLAGKCDRRWTAAELFDGVRPS
jgi:transcriptional regulator with XRE-family HTH domain